MTSPTEDHDARSRARLAARASIVLPMAAFLLSAIVQQLVRDQSPATQQVVNLIAGTILSLMIVGGFASGVAGYIGGRRGGSTDTMLIALLGLFCSGGAIVLTIWAIAVVLRAR